MKKLIKSEAIVKSFDLIFSPFTYLAVSWLKLTGIRQNMPITENIYMKLGVLPIPDHYYFPLINPNKHLKKSLREDRNLPGIDFNIQEQLELLSKFNFNDELESFPLNKTGNLEFYYNNGSFISGDAEYLYNMIRHFQPSKIIEIGSGNSTLMARNGISFNLKNNAFYQCQHICIEPYEMPWLERCGVEVIRSKVEDLDPGIFKQLNENDILFIDSSHIIRPQGDVLTEFLEILPALKPGVIIHIHDIFSPKDYLDEWIETHRLWNEQYLLEAFLNFNSEFRIIGACNYLYHNYYQAFSEKCPVLAKQGKREPGSFWMVKN